MNTIPQIPVDGICPHCNKERGHTPIKWSVFPDFVGCKYCFRKWIPNTDQRRIWADEQRLKLEQMLAENDNSPDHIIMLRQEIAELRVLMLQMMEMVQPKIRISGGDEIPEMPDPDSHPDVLKSYMGRQLHLSPLELTVRERERVGRHCVGDELKKVLGVRLGDILERGTEEGITNPWCYVAPRSVIEALREPSMKVEEKIIEMAPSDWKDAAVDWVMHYRMAEYIRMVWVDMEWPELTEEDHERYGWTVPNAQ